MKAYACGLLAKCQCCRNNEDVIRKKCPCWIFHFKVRPW